MECSATAQRHAEHVFIRELHKTALRACAVKRRRVIGRRHLVLAAARRLTEPRL